MAYRPLYKATGRWVRPHAMCFEAVELWDEDDGRRA